MKRIIVVMLGRSIEGILRDVPKHFNAHSILIVRRNEDGLEPPDGYEVLSVEEFNPQLRDDEEFVVIANGGTAEQFAGVMFKLYTAGVPLNAYSVQRDGVREVWPRLQDDDKRIQAARGALRGATGNEAKLACDLTETEARSLYFGTPW